MTENNDSTNIMWFFNKLYIYAVHCCNQWIFSFQLQYCKMHSCIMKWLNNRLVLLQLQINYHGNIGPWNLYLPFYLWFTSRCFQYSVFLQLTFSRFKRPSQFPILVFWLRASWFRKSRDGASFQSLRYSRARSHAVKCRQTWRPNF